MFIISRINLRRSLLIKNQNLFIVLSRKNFYKIKIEFEEFVK